MSLRTLLAAALCAAVFPVLATPQLRDATDMWYDPAESGWGLNLIHQGNVLFGTLFVYGADGLPKWYVASDLEGGPSVYTGVLRECTGNWYGEAFNPSMHSCRDVGTLRFEMGAHSAGLLYSIDSVTVSKTVQRWTFRRTTLAGSYEGYILQPATAGSGETGRTDLTLNISDDGSTFTMDTSSDSQSPCTWRGTPTQEGAIETVGGTYTCTGRSGSWFMSVDPTTEGFTGTFSGDGITGRITAARSTGTVRMQGYGWRNDMWYNPAESGWGLNVIEQGDTLFATLFVYDAQKRPHWYSASNLTQQGDAADGQVTYTGPLVETTGPYYAAGSFNPSAVTRRVAGQMSFQAHPDGTASLNYNIDGVPVVKQIQRFAFRKQSFTGSYLGSYAHDRQAVITIDDDGADFRMHLVDVYGGMGTCDFVAPFVQVGSLREMNGTWMCAASGGSFTMRNATVSADGFTARFDTPMFDFRAIANGHIAGVRR